MKNVLLNKKILVAVAGGIAAYKIVYVVRELLRRGAKVRVMMTNSAQRFVQPTTFSSILGNRVGVGMFEADGNVNTLHLDMPHWADLILVAPATADILAKMTYGMADDLVSTALLAAECPIFVAPAMNGSMYSHPATQNNVKILVERGVQKIGPEYGEMAAPGEKSGLGRMSEPDKIIQALEDHFEKLATWRGKKVLITAGRTEESIDDVRVLSNRSSGRMGVALARAARDRGAEVVLIHGAMDVKPPEHVKTYSGVSALEMFDLVKANITNSDVAIFAAAVADWRPKGKHNGKLKRSSLETTPTIELVENPDIAKETASMCPGITIGFALETSLDIEEAKEKRVRKGLDAILLNEHLAIGAADSQLIWLDGQGRQQVSEAAEKSVLSWWVLDQIDGLHAKH
ncbi:bifunctional phosphopantothenoylcysteine decarboxylase/phosphopantothenate--cysteine ligase CoaBC [bacterium]|nr:bifunctional phosphopantothenoylcysteine decarboxylase/phosphopantothenate--cysteine ligase CoaBC [bacterium]